MNSVGLYARSANVLRVFREAETTSENADTVDLQWLSVDPINLDNGKTVAIDGEYIVGIT
jgi:hypothetical protein